MPKIVDYPRASFRTAFALAHAVEDLGGIATPDLAADKLGKKVGGGFKAIIAAAAKHGLVEFKKGRLSITSLYRDHKLAYTKEEQDQIAQRAFLGAPLYRTIFERFRGKKIPVAHFEKLLIREFAVPDEIASRVAKYFIDGARSIGLLDSDFVVASSLDASAEPSDGSSTQEVQTDDSGDVDQESTSTRIGTPPVLSSTTTEQRTQPIAFTVRISGPGIDSVLAVNEGDDFEIVRAMLKKIERQLREAKDAKKDEGKQEY